MLRISHAQHAILAAARRRQTIDLLCAHLRDHFAADLAGMGQHALRRRVVLAVRRAAAYGLATPRDYCRYLNLAATYGWDFDTHPAHAWMHACLADPQVGDPGQRLARLVDQCLYRERVARHNRALRQPGPAFEQSPGEHDGQ